MRAYILFLTLLSISFSGLYGQVTLSTQAEVDAWDQSITELTGDVTISGNDITNVDALSNLTSISGILTLDRNIVLTNINGLSNISSITGILTIGSLYGNAVLTNIDGLSGLEDVEGTLSIDSNNALININGLSNISTITGTVKIGDTSGNNALSNIEGLLGLESVEGTLEIDGNNALTNIDGLAGLTSLNGFLGIFRHGNLTNIDGISGLTSITGTLELFANAALTNINGLSNLTSVEGLLDLSESISLINIDGLSGVTSIEGTLIIEGFNNLTNIDGLSNLTSVSGILKIGDIYGNASITNIDGLSGLTSIEGTVEIYRNDALTNVDGLSNLTNISGTLIIRWNDDALTNIDGLSGLTNVNGTLEIFNNNVLTNVDGLSNLTNVDGTLEISSNNLLTNTSGLSGLTGINGTVEIYRNDALPNIDGLSGLTNINGTLDIDYNDALVNIDGLANIESLSGILNIGGFIGNATLINVDGLSGLTNFDGTLNIGSNDALTGIDGLSSLTSLDGILTIENNNSLTNIEGLSNLSSINADGDLKINDNIVLTNIDGLSGLKRISGVLDIDFNDDLLDVNGLTNLDTLYGDLRIDFNFKLSDCCVLKKFSQSANLSVFANDFGCSSIEEILEYDCGLEVKSDINPPCIGISNGTIKLYAINYDTLPFNYLWENDLGQGGSGTSYEDIICIENLAEGSYNVSVSQPNDEEVEINDLILDPINSPDLDITAISTVNSINGFDNGKITLEFSGGIAPYIISYIGPVSDSHDDLNNLSFMITDLSAGEYTVFLEDTNGITRSIEVTILNDNLSLEECNRPMDIIILNLVSNSISAEEYSQSKEYFQAFIENLELESGSTQTNLAIAEWSGRDQQDIKIALSGNIETLEEYKYQSRSFTNNADPIYGIRYGYEYLQNNGRPNAQKVIIFTFDGCPGFSAAQYCEELKEEGVIIADIGIDYISTSLTYQNILKKAASREKLAYFAPNFDDLDPIELAIDLSYENCSGTSSNVYFSRDGSITIDEIDVDCSTFGTVDITFTVSAMEQLSIPIGTPVSFYNNDPLQYNAGLISTFIIPCLIEAGETETFTITLPIASATHLFAVLNDDAETNAPFTFPVTDIQENFYSNNIDDIIICVDVSEATVQAFKSAVSIHVICDDIVQYTIDVCNISQVDAEGVMIQDDIPTGFVLTELLVNDNDCAIDNSGAYDIAAGCCVSMTLSYNVSTAAAGYYGDQDVFLSGPANQEYIDFDGASTSAEDILIDGTEDCGDPTVTFSKEVSDAITCVDHSMSYTFTIDNKSSNPLYNVQFTDILPAPLEWVYKPYDMQGLNVSMDDFLEGQSAVFRIDRIDAETVASFTIDVYVGYTDVEVIANNTARIEGFPDFINNGIDFLESNTTTTTILGDIEILSLDTITVAINDGSIDLSAVISPMSGIEWSSDGDGTFSNVSIADPIYTLGPEDRLDTLIGLFIGVDTHCGQKGKSIFIRRECDLEFNPITLLQVCEDETIDAELIWSGGIGPFTIEEISEDLEMDTSVIISSLAAGMYSYSLIDAMGCEAVIEVRIDEVAAPIIMETVTQPDCDADFGSVELDWTGSSTVYDISGDIMDQGISSPYVIDLLPIGNYTVTITDEFGCSDVVSFEIESQETPQVEVTPSCIDPTMYAIDIVTGDFEISSDLGIPAVSTGGDNYTIFDIPIDSPIVITVTDLTNNCENVINITPPDCSCTAIANVGNDLEISCYEESAILDAGNSTQGADYSYAWYDSAGNLLSTELEYETDIADVYTFEIFDLVFNCSTTAQVIVTDIRNTPDASITALETELTCDNNNIELSIAPEENAVYTWMLENGNQITDNTINISEEGEVMLSVLDTLTGCTNASSINIDDNRILPNITIAEPTLLNCENSEVIIDASGSDAVEVTWMDSNLETLPENGLTLATTEPGIFYLQLVNGDTGCSILDSIEVMADYSEPEIDLVDEISLTCDDELTLATAEINSSNDYNISWTILDELIGSDESISITESGTYVIEVQDQISQCSTIDTLVVTPAEEIEGLVLSHSDLNCFGDSSGSLSFIEVLGGSGDYSYFINNQMVEASMVDGLSAGDYEIRVEDMMGCAYDTLVTILEPETLLSDFNLEEYIIPSGSSIEVEIITNIPQEEIASIIWSPAIDCQDCLSFLFENVLDETSYTVTVTDNNGCQESLEFRIVADNSIDIYLPNIINASSGHNGVFFPQTFDIDLNVKEMYIYDRWGNLVFQNKDFPVNDPAFGWDGSFKGEPAVQGVYVYSVIVETEEEEIKLTGDVTLIR
jgi:uncharacterized repeat protein (TIGR01451 family)